MVTYQVTLHIGASVAARRDGCVVDIDLKLGAGGDQGRVVSPWDRGKGWVFDGIILDGSSLDDTLRDADLASGFCLWHCGS